MNISKEIEITREQVRRYLKESRYWKIPIQPKHLNDAVRSYLELGGKYIRPCMLLWSCRALGGDEERAVPAALALELFHTWTLVHDDVIDRDDLRRGKPTLHEEYRRKGMEELQIKEEFAAHYGESLAILTGDVLHAWSVRMWAKANNAEEEVASAPLILKLICELERPVLTRLIEGQVLDLQLSQRPLARATEGEILRAIMGKTAVLFSFAARSGAHLARNEYLPKDMQVAALGEYGFHAGMAFQLQDDILGLSGDTDELGKPVGSDIREGKRTVPLLHCWTQSDEETRTWLEKVVGNPDSDESEIAQVKEKIKQVGSLEYTRELAKQHHDYAIASLEAIEKGTERDLLAGLVGVMLERSR